MSVITFPTNKSNDVQLQRKTEALIKTCGWVYILTNELMPDLVKIGYTTGCVEKRRKELSRATGVPCSFTLVDGFRCMQAAKVERRTHEFLSFARVSGNREFFRASPQTAIEAMWHADIDVNENTNPQPDEVVERLIQAYGSKFFAERIKQVRGFAL